MTINNTTCLKLEEAVSAVPGHVDQDVGALVRQQPLRPTQIVLKMT